MQQQKDKLHIMLCLSRFGIGGIQTFVIGLANYLVQNLNVRVSVYCYTPELIAMDDNEPLDSQVHVHTLSKNKYKVILINKLRNILHIFIKFDIKKWLIHQHFLAIVRKEKVSVIHSNIHITDTLGLLAKKKLGTPLLLSSHGSYNGEVTAELHQLMLSISEEADYFVYTTEKNLINFNRLNINLSKKRFIPNGIERPKEAYSMDDNKKYFFGIIARGVEEKGWRELKEAFLLVRQKNTKVNMLIIADGDLPAQLFSNQEDIGIKFLGPTKDYFRYLAQCKVGVLPTYLPDESMPFSIITHLALQQPVIATNNGSIPWMITDEKSGECAGHIIDLDSVTGKPKSAELADVMLLYLNNNELYNQKITIAAKAFDKFSIEHCAKKYMSLYTELI